jgi:hypothetical protein
MKTAHTQGDWELYFNGPASSPDWVIIPKGKTDNETFICKLPNEPKWYKRREELKANAKLIATAPELLQMVYDLKNCIKRLTEDDLTQFDRDKEAQWIGDAHELLLKVNPDYYKNANS